MLFKLPVSHTYALWKISDEIKPVMKAIIDPKMGMGVFDYYLSQTEILTLYDYLNNDWQGSFRIAYPQIFDVEEVDLDATITITRRQFETELRTYDAWAETFGRRPENYIDTYWDFAEGIYVDKLTASRFTDRHTSEYKFNPDVVAKVLDEANKRKAAREAEAAKK
tara:strand:- start:19333 stop:19830 length:498 start_codon:yes stop_codon:yes gene_type:complete